MNKIKLLLAILAITLVTASSFKPSNTAYFYEYTGSLSSQSEVEDYTNYTRTNASCSESEGDLCGIFLQTDTGYGNPPVESEFVSIKACITLSWLWRIKVCIEVILKL